MPWFRAPSRASAASSTEPGPLEVAVVRSVIADVMKPAHFFTGESLALEWEEPGEESISWEIYQGRLLDRSHTRRLASLEAWNIFQVVETGRSGEPILSVKLEAPARQIHVTRAIYCRAWEGYHAGDNVYLSRETRKWVRELVGTIHWDRFHHVDELRDEIVCRLFQAVVGVSRLPLTSVEAPLPAFSLGKLGYFYRRSPGAEEVPSGPVRSYPELMPCFFHPELAWLEKTKLLELLVRSVPPAEVNEAADLFLARWKELKQTKQDLLALLRNLFNEVSLSPYTDFVNTALALVGRLAAKDEVLREDLADFLGHLLRQLARHLTAYDLVTFHHRGANYPDALFLDAVLKVYLDLMAKEPALFMSWAGDTNAEEGQKRLRRRALRHGWLLRRFYEGLAVPNAPTSPGENARILPSSHEVVPEEQILSPARRTKRLFEGDPFPAFPTGPAGEVLRQSIRDLHHPLELRELGTALFLDRPLGHFEKPAEPDQTLLFSYLAFSRSIARRRLQYLTEDLNLGEDPLEFETCKQRLDNLQVGGIALRPLPGTARAGAVSLDDALKSADDWVILRTTDKTVSDFFSQFDVTAVTAKLSPDDWLFGRPLIIVRETAIGGERANVLVVFDSLPRRRLELQILSHLGYESRGGLEYPAGGFQVIRAWERIGTSQEWHESHPEDLILRPQL